MSFPVKFSTDAPFTVKFKWEDPHEAEFSPYIEVPVVDYYNGDYNITPSAQEQTIPIIGKTARRDITVGAIPNNYGLITWNGSVITVS